MRFLEKSQKTGWAANRTSPECFCLITGRSLWRCPRSRRVDAITSLAPVNNSDLAGVDLTRSRRVRSGRARADRDGRGKSSAAIPGCPARRMTNAKYANDLILTSSSAAGGVWMRPLKHRLLDVSKCPAVILDTTVKQTTAQLLSRITYFLSPLNFATVCFVSKHVFRGNCRRIAEIYLCLERFYVFRKEMYLIKTVASFIWPNSPCTYL